MRRNAKPRTTNLIRLEKAGKIGGLELQKAFRTSRADRRGHLRLCGWDAAFWGSRAGCFRVIDVKASRQTFKPGRKMMRLSGHRGGRWCANGDDLC